MDLVSIATTLFGEADWRRVGAAIEIRDLSGALLFLDYVLEGDEGRGAWIRCFASQPGAPIVSAEEGKHPTLIQNTVDLSTKSTNLGTLRLGADQHPAVFCYHYPSLAVMEVQDGEQVLVDLVDGRKFKLFEQGDDDDSAEVRAPYSFLRHMPELGDPGDFDVPTPEFRVNGPLIPQQRDNWCAAASCQMVLASIGVDVPQDRIAALMKIPQDPSQGGASSSNQLEAFEELIPYELKADLDLDPLGAECIQALLGGRAVKVGIWRHAQAVFGWKKVENQVLYLIHDPLPVGGGSIKYQNPHIVWSINHITLEKRSDSMAKVKDALQDLIGMPLPDVLKKYAADLTKEEAELLRKLTAQDLENMRKSDSVIGAALGESGGGEGCGVYY